ncbi:hypothetical protein R6Q59_019840 [Mikania micrantha]
MKSNLKQGWFIRVCGCSFVPQLSNVGSETVSGLEDVMHLRCWISVLEWSCVKRYVFGWDLYAFFLACYLRSYGVCFVWFMYVAHSQYLILQWIRDNIICVAVFLSILTRLFPHIIGQELRRTRVVRRVHDCNHRKLRIKSHHSVSIRHLGPSTIQQMQQACNMQGH